MALQNLAGTTPDGVKTSLPISGRASLSITPLGANETWSSGWIETFPYSTVATTIFSDVPSAIGGYMLEFSEDGGETLSQPSIPNSYTEIGKKRKGAFDIDALWIRFTYTNGAVAQSRFLFNIRLLDQQIQTSSETLSSMGADTRLASWVKARIETKDSDNGSYLPVYRTNNGLNVHVDNPTDLSSLAKNATLTDGTQKVQVTNQPSVQQISGTVAVSGSVEVANDSGNPLPVLVSNLPTTQVVSGTLAINNFPATQPVSGTVTANVTFPSSQTINGSVLVSNLPAVQSISAASLPLPAGAATSANQSTTNSKLDTIATNQGTQSTSALQTTGNTTLATIASNQAVQATSALQNAGNTSLSNIDSKIPSKGQSTGSLSFPVVLASDTTLPLPTGAATAALQQLIVNASLKPSTGAIAIVTTTATATTALAANTSRKGATISCITGPVYIGLGSTVTTTSFTLKMATGSYYEVPFGYTGIITAIGAGSINLTELI